MDFTCTIPGCDRKADLHSPRHQGTEGRFRYAGRCSYHGKRKYRAVKALDDSETRNPRLEELAESLYQKRVLEFADAEEADYDRAWAEVKKAGRAYERARKNAQNSAWRNRDRVRTAASELSVNQAEVQVRPADSALGDEPLREVPPAQGESYR